MSAAAARCLLVPASPPATGSPETVKAPASIPTSCPDASVPVRAAVGPSSGRRIPAPPLRCSSSSAASPAAPELGVLLEVEGVLADVYRFGNRQAFNVAFQSLGLDCANWTEPIYADLVRKSRGDEEMMLVLFFDRVAGGDLENKWLIDSSCSRHMNEDSSCFSSLTLAKRQNYITFGDDRKGRVKAKYMVRVNESFTLKDVTLVEHQGYNLLSISQLLDEDLEVHSKRDTYRVLDSSGTSICTIS